MKSNGIGRATVHNLIMTNATCARREYKSLNMYIIFSCQRVSRLICSPFRIVTFNLKRQFGNGLG